MNADPQTSPTPPRVDHSLPRLFIAGIAGWLLGMIGVFLTAWLVQKQDDLALALLWTLGRWWIGFLVGAAALLIVALASKLPAGRGLAAFVLPVAVLGSLAALCVAIYPDRGMRDDLMTFLPVVVFFYVLALLWMSMSRDGGGRSQFMRAVIPPVVGGLALLVGVAAPVFGSNAFRYRDTFGLKVNGTRIENGTLVCDGVLTIRTPEKFTFRAPRYVWNEDGSATEEGRFVWGDAGKPAGSTGDFPFIVEWTKGVPAGGVDEIGLYEDMLWLEVRRADAGNEVVYSLCEPLVRR